MDILHFVYPFQTRGFLTSIPTRGSFIQVKGYHQSSWSKSQWIIMLGSFSVPWSFQILPNTDPERTVLLWPSMFTSWTLKTTSGSLIYFRILLPTPTPTVSSLPTWFLDCNANYPQQICADWDWVGVLPTPLSPVLGLRACAVLRHQRRPLLSSPLKAFLCFPRKFRWKKGWGKRYFWLSSQSRRWKEKGFPLGCCHDSDLLCW